MNTLGKRIKKEREEKGFNQIELAGLLQISNTTLSQYESGQRIPSDDIKIKLSEIFDCTVDYLLGRTDLKKPLPPTLDDGANELLEELHKRPEMKMLFSVSKKATREDIERAVKIIEALKEE